MFFSCFRPFWVWSVTLGTPMPTPSLSTTSSPCQHFSTFSLFLVWKSYGCLETFPSFGFFEFICMESSSCLVSNGSRFVQFGATVVEILRLEGRWCKVEKFWMSFLEKFISFNLELISSSPFGENLLRPCYSRWSSPFISILAQSIKFIVQSRVKNCQLSWKTQWRLY